MCGGDDAKQFYVTLFSNASVILYSENTIAAFTANLARPIELVSNDKRKVMVCEFAYPPTQGGGFKETTVVGDTTGLIYIDLTSPQYVGRALIRCLRTFIYPSLSGQHAFDNVYYLPVEKLSIKKYTDRHIECEWQAGRIQE